MAGYIYISGVYETVVRKGCAIVDEFIDNDPHFYTQPPTWGICRSDIRKNRGVGEYVFFVLPAHPKNLPQMIYGYMRIERKTTHEQAYAEGGLRSKRMGRKNPNGNIIVDAAGAYNVHDGGVHLYDFDRIKKTYMIGDVSDSMYLTTRQIKKLAPSFQTVLNRVFRKPNAQMPIDVISRKGRTMTDSQASELKNWLLSATR
ncbi:MAG: hypothetical protein JSS75_05995 [Bacteroidetes bacterium]|nr:hypothetical protein [Bacteroidota bacterium]